jgi:hypothetical protein
MRGIKDPCSWSRTDSRYQSWLQALLTITKTCGEIGEDVDYFFEMIVD